MVKLKFSLCIGPGRQRGAIVLVSVVLMLVMVTLVTLYTGRIQSFEHKIILNSQNQKFAFAAASAGLSQGLAELQHNKNWPLATVTGMLPNLQRFNVAASAQSIIRNSRQFLLFEMTSTGSSVDGLSTVSVSEQAIIYPLLSTVPVAPLMTDGGIDNRSTFELIANPNGAGQGVALSIWSNGGVDMLQINGLSCGFFEYTNRQCQSRAYSRLGEAGADILANDLAFPIDLFAHLFNVSLTHYPALRDEADLLLADCSALAPQTSAFIWVTGDCDIPANIQVGSVISPVILVVEEGSLSLGNGVNIYGLVFVLKDPASVISHDVLMSSTSLLTGALVANQVLGRTAGKFRVLYDYTILHLLSTEPHFLRVAKVPGSWEDS
ncbi:hypothetical protein [Paraglaciecola sp.]|uniref:hypothetical protein n=1 Tax=Paraglaciecola sp. TaxID=1920173 RepID=UPI0030F41288